jgi:hypothetical protein
VEQGLSSSSGDHLSCICIDEFRKNAQAAVFASFLGLRLTSLRTSKTTRIRWCAGLSKVPEFGWGWHEVKAQSLEWREKSRIGQTRPRFCFSALVFSCHVVCSIPSPSMFRQGAGGSSIESHDSSPLTKMQLKQVLLAPETRESNPSTFVTSMRSMNGLCCEWNIISRPRISWLREWCKRVLSQACSLKA